MLITGFVCPLLYSWATGSAWSAWSKQKFSSSLAPAYMAHILLVMVSGMLFKSLSIGIFGGTAIALVMLAAFVLREQKQAGFPGFREYAGELWKNGGAAFTVFYVLCFVLNTNKIFMHWDEFSHWGPFLKESLRTDRLYCMSPVEFAHKDYVPAVTLFETIWCRLGFRFTEPDALRAIQIFMFSLLMPMFEGFSSYASGELKGSEGKGVKDYLKYGFLKYGSVLFVLLLPLIFYINQGFCFYHSICCDVVFGIMFYWCLYDAYRDYEDRTYSLAVLAIGLSVFVLCKMTAMALFPFVVMVFIGKNLFFSGQKPNVRQWLLILPAIAFPLVLWAAFNRFVDRYVENTGGAQSYDGMKLSSVAEVFTDPAKSAISYLGQVRSAYVDALVHRGILIRNSYLTAMLLIVVLFVVVALLADSEKKLKIFAAAALTAVAGIYYAVLMYFLYATAFSESEAVTLASYERYMNSFVIAALLFLVAVYYDSGLWKRFTEGYCWIVTLLILDLAILHHDYFRQVLPGNISHDEEMIQRNSASLSESMANASAIMEATQEDESIYVVKGGEMEDFLWRERYYCNPRTIGGGNIGFAGAVDMPPEELLSVLKDYDYIYFCGIDGTFSEKYAGIFEDPAQITDDKICRISEEGGRIRMEEP